MRAFAAEEDILMLHLIEEHGHKWKVIADKMNESHRGIEVQRTAAMIRNRFYRMQQGKTASANGKARNKCGLCGQTKAGHICTGVAPKLPTEIGVEAPQLAQERQVPQDILSRDSDTDTVPLELPQDAEKDEEARRLLADSEAYFSDSDMFVPPAGLFTPHTPATTIGQSPQTSALLALPDDTGDVVSPPMCIPLRAPIVRAESCGLDWLVRAASQETA